MKNYSFLPEVQQANHRADEAERVAERLGDILAQAISALTRYDASAAQQLRATARQASRGVLPRVAQRLDRIVLPRSPN